MASKAELKGRVSLDNRAFKAKMRRMSRSARKFKAGMKRLGVIGKRAMLGMTAAAVGGAAAIFKLTKATADAGDPLQKMALRTGLTVKNLEELNYISQITGTEVGLIQKGMKQLARSISYAKDGLTTYTREFDKMGLLTDDFQGKDVNETFDMVIKSLAGMDDRMQQAATAATLFGRAGQMLIPMIRMNGDGLDNLRKRFHEIGYAFGRDGADKAADFNDALTDIKTAMEGVRNKLVLSFMESFENGIDGMTDKIVEFRKQGKFTEWSANAATAVNNFVASALKNFTWLEEHGSAMWKYLKTEGIIAMQGIALGFKKYIKPAFSDTGFLKRFWQELKRIDLERTATSDFSSPSVKLKAKRDLQELKEEIRKTDQAGIQSAQNRMAEIQKLQSELNANVEKLKDFSTWADADADATKKIRRIEQQQLKLNQTIANWKEKAVEAEKRKSSAAKDGADALGAQTDELNKQKALREPLKGVFGIPMARQRPERGLQRPEVEIRLGEGPKDEQLSIAKRMLIIMQNAQRRGTMPEAIVWG